MYSFVKDKLCTLEFRAPNSREFKSKYLKLILGSADLTSKQS